MQKWEYKVVNFYTEEDWTKDSIKKWERLLNKYGAERWELVSIHDSLAYFKRPVMDKPPIYRESISDRMASEGL
jgi:hypothetical protein